MVDRVIDVEGIDEILISTNLRFKDQFEKWLESRKLSKASLIVEPSTREEEKLGAVKALARITERINDNCLIVAGDNLFTSSIRPLVERFRTTGMPVVGMYNIGDRELAKQYSTISVDSDGRIVRFLEKPTNPESTLIGTAIYVLPRTTLPKLKEFTSFARDQDSPGRFIEWLCTKEPTYGVALQGRWWDIGTLDQYAEINRMIAEIGIEVLEPAEGP